MSTTFDYIVLGTGGFGSSAVYHLARRGARVLGLEQFGRAHDQGSSHGETRVIRKAYFEHADYVPLLMRAYELWRQLEQDCRRPLYHEVGLVLGGLPDSEVITGAEIAASRHELTIENLTAAEARQRFPAYAIPEEFVAVYEPEAGYLEVEACVEAHLSAAEAAGAALQLDEPVQSWDTDGRTVRVRTAKTDYEAAGLVITAGAWSGKLLAELNIPLTILRKVLLWYATPQTVYDVQEGNPCFFFETDGGEFYGFPRINGMVKMAEHSGGDVVASPESLDRELRSDDQIPVTRFINALMPGLPDQPAKHGVCMYTKTPDSHFIVDHHPEHCNVVLGAGFSGHGFKFTSSIGEALADLAADGRTDLPIGFLSLSRPSLTSD